MEESAEAGTGSDVGELPDSGGSVRIYGLGASSTMPKGLPKRKRLEAWILDRGLRGISRRVDAVRGEHGLRPMLIRTDDHALVDDLCAHFRRSAFEVADVGGGMIEVKQPGSRSDLDERRAIRNHLALWRVLHPDSAVYEVP